jgi:hypothetical protein
VIFVFFFVFLWSSRVPYCPFKYRAAFDLEGKLQRHLNLARVASRRKLAASAARGGADRAVGIGRRNACVDAEPLSMVEDLRISSSLCYSSFEDSSAPN